VTGTQDAGAEEGGTQEGGAQEGGAREGGAEGAGAHEGGAQVTGAEGAGAHEGGAQVTGAEGAGARDGAAAAKRRRRRIIGLALPATGALIADPLLGLVDTAVAGRLGTDPLAALGLSVAVLASASWVFNFLVYGTTAAVAKAVGAGDRHVAGRRVVHAAWLATGIGLVLSVLILVLAPSLVRWLGASSSFADEATTYLRVRAVGLVPFLLTYVGHGAFRGVSDTRTPLVIVVGANVVNASLDVVLVFGLGAGLAGVAWATVAAEVGAALAFAVLIRRAGLPLLGHGRPTTQEVRTLVSVSRDLFLRTGSLVAAFLVVASVAARLGAVTAAAHQIVWQVWTMVALFLDGLAIAGQALIGTALGAGDPREARATAAQLTRWGLGVGIATAVVLLALRDLLPRLLTDEPVVLAALGGAWVVAALGHTINGVVFVLDGVFMGAEDFAYLRTWVVIAALGVAAPLALLVLALDGGLVGLWLALTAMLVVRLASLLARLRGTTWTGPAP